MTKPPEKSNTELVETQDNGTIHPVRRPRTRDPLSEQIAGFRELQRTLGARIINASKAEGHPLKWVILNGLEVVNGGNDLDELREALNQAVQDCATGFRMPGDNDLVALSRPVAIRINEIRAAILRVVVGGEANELDI